MEEWRKVHSFPNYSISDEGRLRNDDTNHIRKNKTDKYGYEYVNLKQGGRTHSKFIHRLVAEEFIDNPDRKPQVNHKDGNKKNNRVDNLEYVTASENMQHAYRTGLNKYTFRQPMLGHKNPHPGYGKKPVRCVDTGEEFESLTKCANEMDLNVKHIGDVIHGRRRTHKGHKFEFV